MKPDFGAFNPIFESAHGYLALLNLGGDDAFKAVELVMVCCRTAATLYPDIYRLLEDPNWRPHLVAAVAVIVSGYDNEAARRLWRRLDTGSWVTPQIGVALYLVDHDFESQSRARLEAGCPVDVTELLLMTGPERHSAAGPAGRIDRSAKTAATLLRLLRLGAPVPDWVERASTSDQLRRLLAQDIDASASIAESWLHRIQEITSGLK